ncbi:MAG: lipopolysaccharide biosynthesis protein, partial [Lachnoanaerobaculum saburreum]
KWLFLGAFIDLYIFAAAKYAVNYRLGEEFNGYFSIIFIPTSIINLMAGFVIRPILTKLSLLFKTGNTKSFVSTISKIAVFIIAATIFGMLAAYIFGIPVLKLVLGDVGSAIEPYKTALVLVILGGGLYAVVNLGYYCLVIFEMTGVIFFIYVIGAVFAYFFSDFMVKIFAMNGAAIAYMITMLLLTVFFLAAVILGLRKVKK